MADAACNCKSFLVFNTGYCSLVSHQAVNQCNAMQRSYMYLKCIKTPLCQHHPFHLTFPGIDPLPDICRPIYHAMHHDPSIHQRPIIIQVKKTHILVMKHQLKLQLTASSTTPPRSDVCRRLSPAPTSQRRLRPKHRCGNRRDHLLVGSRRSPY